jgi:two-component system NarL family sensor kinase
MGAVAVYRSEGVGATAFVIAGVLVFAFVASRLRTERSNRDEIASLAASRGRLVAQILEAEDRERRIVAQAIHDELIQTLLAVRQDMADEGEASPDAREQISDAIRQARRIIRGVHPTVLDQVGLDAAVRAIAEQAAIRGGLVVGVTVNANTVGLHDRLVFAAIRELLSNVQKHARATKVAIRVRQVANKIRLTVVDDGVGVSDEEPLPKLLDGHIGLSSLAERAEALGGTLTVRRIERGTEVELMVPVPGLSHDLDVRSQLASVSEH